MFQFWRPEILLKVVDCRVPKGKLIQKIEAFDLVEEIKRDVFCVI